MNSFILFFSFKLDYIKNGVNILMIFSRINKINFDNLHFNRLLFESFVFARVYNTYLNVNEEGSRRTQVLLRIKHWIQDFPQDCPHHESSLHWNRRPSTHICQAWHLQTCHSQLLERRSQTRSRNSRFRRVIWNS